MRLALISDIHANYPALRAMLEVLDEMEIDNWLCLGDLVGYGPQPEECISEIRQREIPCLLGNHDSAVLDFMPLIAFKEPNRSLLEQTKGLLSRESLSFLKKCQLVMSSKDLESKSGSGSGNGNGSGSGRATWLAAHASPDEPAAWTYLDSAVKCREVLQQFNEYDFIFVGHTHCPAMIAEKLGVITMKKGNRYMLNPGSIGQPRDGDERPSAMIIDTDEFEYQKIRVEYDVEETLAAYKPLGISQKNARRLLKLKKKKSKWWFF